jgi:hypothetical protein
MSRDLRDALSANARNKAFFSLSPEDAHSLARHTLPELSEHDLSAARAAPGISRPGGTVRSWPLLVLAAPAAAEVWSGWVGIAQKTGFGLVSPLPTSGPPCTWTAMGTALAHMLRADAGAPDSEATRPATAWYSPRLQPSVSVLPVCGSARGSRSSRCTSSASPTGDALPLLPRRG